MNKYAGANRFAAQGLWNKKRRDEGKKVTVSKAPWEEEELHADVTYVRQFATKPVEDN
tara:strand:- start:777 stop:950 length:174 start_codon:yes stop_codon:yes gene_type:complete